ncbi:hypothetical protein B0H34DRAFT_699182 [Crassisporium funariophilum]|nr:hypothetical protein B0H34DRAFT_699182 [Crassisporium funariophilum]
MDKIRAGSDHVTRSGIRNSKISLARMSSTSTKKRKEIQAEQIPQKKPKRSHNGNISDFQVVKASLVISVPPIFAANPRAGIEEMLDSMIMRYIPSLRGVVLSHSNLSFVNRTADIQGDCPFLVCSVAFDATVWSPRVGFKLCGKVNLCSPDHLSLLVHRTFNVSIPRHHIPTDVWEFEYGPAENDPEYGQPTQDEDDLHQVEKTSKINHDTGGKWVHRLTGEKLGEVDGILEFTVIGLTVANEMLSLLGSLQPDPLSPEHVAHSQVLLRKNESESDESDFDDNDDADLEIDSDVIDLDESDAGTFQVSGRKEDLREAKRKGSWSKERAESQKKRKHDSQGKV